MLLKALSHVCGSFGDRGPQLRGVRLSDLVKEYPSTAREFVLSVLVFEDKRVP